MKPLLSQKQLKNALLLVILTTSIIITTYALQSSTIIPSTGTIYYQPEAQILFTDGYESGNFDAWNGTKTTTDDQAIVISTLPYDGTYHAQYKTNAIPSGTRYAYSYVNLATPISEVYTRAYFYIIDGLPLDDNDDRFGLISYEVNGQIQCSIRVHRSGGVDRFNVIGFNGTSTVQKGTDAVYPTEGQWYCIEFYIKVHSVRGEYRAWINGVEQITLTNLDTTRYGKGVNRIRVGITSSINVQHNVTIYCDAAAVSTRYIGQFYAFAVVGAQTENPAIANFYWLFGNQSIRYKALEPSQVKGLVDIDLFDGLVVWTKHGGYNAEAVKKFAQTRIVIAHIWDFCNMLYPSLNNSAQIVTTNTVTYVRDFGNFRSGDIAEMRNETGNVNKLTTVLSSVLDSFSNISRIAQYDTNRVAFFHMNGTRRKSGFYVMDLDATTPETEWTGIWHLFPVIKMIRDFPTGKYARWFAIGVDWPSVAWVYSWMSNFTEVNGDIVTMRSIGTSVQGQPINALFIGKGKRYALVDGSIHGNEKSTTFACLRLAEVILEDYRASGYWSKKLEEYTIIIVPILNPDGFAANSRYNANGKDLNRQFPPGGTTTEPEAWALRWLMGNYTPTIYINNHEGGTSEPNKIFYGPYQETSQKNISMDTIRCTITDFEKLRHWGYFTDGGLNLWIGKVQGPYQGGSSYAIAYASWAHQASSMLIESFVWSSTYKARKCLYAIDYYVCLSLSLISHFDKLADQGFIIYSNAKMESVTWSTQLSIRIQCNELETSSFTKIYVGDRDVPLNVKIDRTPKQRDDGWTFDSGFITVTGALNLIEIAWS
ncbi:MAG: M14 family zinc carboxypeptidase [Candidatus Bathyarchaeia archaeon]